MRSLSFSLWSNYNLFYLCCLIVLNTCQFVYSGSNTTVSLCECNSTTTDPRNYNASNNFCNCTQDTINCTTGHHFQNGTCVKCLCNVTTTPTNCNCSRTQKPHTKLTCLLGQFLTNSSQGQKCENCNCSVYTSLNNNCNNRTGQCPCQRHTAGRDCKICAVNFTANYSSTGELVNCFELAKCPRGFRRTVRNQCIEVHTTRLLASTYKPTSSVMVLSSSYGTSVPASTSTTALTSHSTSLISTLLQSSQKTPSTFLSPSPFIPIPHTTKLPSKKTPPTVKSSSTAIMSPSLTVKSASVSVTSLSATKPPSTKAPLPTGKPVSTNTQQVSTKMPAPTTKIPPTTGQESTTKPTTVTEHPPTQEPTTKVQKDHESYVVVIILVCLGVILILGIAIAVGCWYLRAKRKESTPMWTIELSSTRNEESDFALLDPVTDEPVKKATDNSEVDGPITEHSRYYAYI